jgi:hypothetical protein
MEDLSSARVFIELSACRRGRQPTLLRLKKSHRASFFRMARSGRANARPFPPSAQARGRRPALGLNPRRFAACAITLHESLNAEGNNQPAPLPRLRMEFILASAKKKNYFIVARIVSHAGRMANDETTPNSTLASLKNPSAWIDPSGKMKTATHGERRHMRDALEGPGAASRLSGRSQAACPPRPPRKAQGCPCAVFDRMR